MNDIERAIQHFSRTVAQLKYLDGTVDSHYLKYYIRVRNAKNRRRLQACRAAVDALRDAQEREKGCDQCKEYINDFRFCPNCGKRLDAKEQL